MGHSIANCTLNTLSDFRLRNADVYANVLIAMCGIDLIRKLTQI